ncbi:protein kinase family protein [Hazenella coriacea]|uniref:Tetratricopeptide (TPR) repeat protein n=1 Tax=Hazenella coriacea TaxID=1179467 RepID=A0A4R3LED5_9BACL|nr:protein kinase family protein [Hazenella coriacea]TCS96704.1 tetratricopeptide (TPR) repeat protein [Hazenella coriacea]
MHMKEKGQKIQQYVVLNRFPFIQGLLYYVEQSSTDETSSSTTRFILALDVSSFPPGSDITSLLQRNSQVFFPIEQIFIEDGVVYQVFEKMEGTLFAFYLQKAGPLPLGEVLQLLRNTCEHLYLLKENKHWTIIHPENMCLGSKHQVRFFLGGPVELFSSTELNESESLHQLASTVYTMLTGKWVKQDETVESIRNFRKDVPLELENLLMRSLSPDPSRRPVLQDLLKWVRQANPNTPLQLVAETPPTKVDQHKKVESQPISPKPVKTKKPFTKQRLAITVGGCIALLVTVAFVVTYFFSGGDKVNANTTQAKQAATLYQESKQAVKDKQLNQAIEKADKAIQTDPKEEYYLHLANLYKATQRNDKSIETLKKGTEKFPESPSMFYELSSQAFFNKDYDIAKDAIQKAITLSDGKLSGYFYLRGRIENQMREYDKAIQSLTKAIELRKDVPNYYHERAIASFRNSKLDEAIKDEMVAIQQNPTQGKYDLTLGIIYLEKREEVQKSPSLVANVKLQQMNQWAQKALDAFKEAANDSPKDPDVQYYRSVAHYYCKEYDSALTAINLAVQLNPENALYHYQKGIVQLTTNKKADATQSFTKAVQLEPNSALYQQALQQVKP